MQFARQLQIILQQPAEERIKDIQQWNDDIEKILFGNPKDHKDPSYVEAMDQDQANEQIECIVKELREQIAISLAKALDVTIASADPSQLKLVVDHCQENNSEIITVAIEDANSWKYLENLVQTSGNFFRWYLQIYSQTYPLVYPLASQPFQSTTMLKLMLFLIEYNAIQEEDNTEEPTTELSPSQRFARYAALLLFYATFSPRAPQDENMQQTHERLVADLDFIPKVLGLLTYQTQTSAALALSLLRNVHNLLAGFSGTALAIQQTGLQFAQRPPTAPWNPKPDDNTDGLITYPSIFRDVLIWSLSTPPSFPGPPQDKRPELVVEILGIIFGMGGTEVTRALRYPCPNASLAQLVVTALQFPSEDPRIHQVKLSTIAILTDASPSFGTYLVEQKVLPVLLQIAEGQMDGVIDDTRVDATAVSALVPSLAVLYKLSAGNPTFRESTKEAVFPPSREDRFWKLVEEQSGNAAGGNDEEKEVPSAKNMHPLDAPRGSLRWKLIRLMTWTESHIKRYASELLWALCEEDPKEFVLRTGLGNAMGFLGAKGLVKLPAHALD